MFDAARYASCPRAGMRCCGHADTSAYNRLHPDLCSTRAGGAGSILSGRPSPRRDPVDQPCAAAVKGAALPQDRRSRAATRRGKARASRARSRTHPLTAASRPILASLAPRSTCRFVESNLRGIRCASPDRASGHQVARFTRDCGGFLEGYRILTKTWSGARPGSRAVVVTGLELNETLDTRNPPGGGLV